MENDVRRHNETVPRTLKLRDLLECRRGMYSGNGDAVHKSSQINIRATTVDSSASNVLTTSGSGTAKACVKRESRLDAAENCKVIKNKNEDGIAQPFNGREIKERALSRLGPASYIVLCDNSEHFTYLGTATSIKSDELSLEIIELDVKRHNETVLGTLEVGDLVEFHRGIYSHWGVYVGDGTIVHLTSDDVPRIAVDSSLSNASAIYVTGYKKTCVKRDNFKDVARDSRMIKNNNKDRTTPPLPGREIKERALSRLGPASYNPLWDNCEHFASWCRYGIAVSDQADAALARVGAFVLGALLPAGGGLVYASRTDRSYRRPFNGREIKERALSLVGSQPYNVLGNNCEYYASSCRNGTPVLFQADTAMTWVGGCVLGISLIGIEGLVNATRTDRNDSSCIVLSSGRQIEHGNPSKRFNDEIFPCGGEPCFNDEIFPCGGEPCMEYGIERVHYAVCSEISSFRPFDFASYVDLIRNGIHPQVIHPFYLGCSTGTCGTMNWLN